MDDATRALVEQLKIHIIDSLRGYSFLDLDTLAASWSKEMVEAAISASIPRTGVETFEVGKPYQPTFAQHVDYIKGRLEGARDRLEYAAKYDPESWQEILEDYDHHQKTFRAAVTAMLRRGADTMVPHMMMGNIKIQPVCPVNSIEVTFELGTSRDHDRIQGTDGPERVD